MSMRHFSQAGSTNAFGTWGSSAMRQRTLLMGVPRKPESESTLVWGPLGHHIPVIHPHIEQTSAFWRSCYRIRREIHFKFSLRLVNGCLQIQFRYIFLRTFAILICLIIRSRLLAGTDFDRAAFYVISVICWPSGREGCMFLPCTEFGTTRTRWEFQFPCFLTQTGDGVLYRDVFVKAMKGDGADWYGGFRMGVEFTMSWALSQGTSSLTTLNLE